jgi:spermidine/putrescine transport system ATP-binding protein
MTEPIVQLRDVSKTFTSRHGAVVEEVQAVKKLDLDIPPGEFFTLLGPSGCGKTTTLRLIAGFESPTEGEVLIQGKEVSKVPPNHRPVNTVFQNYALFPHLTVLDNVAFGLAVKRVPRAEREKQAQEALELVRLAGMGDRKPSQLSGGQQQRVALARALVNKPAVLLLDEPLGALDLKLRKAMQIELKQLQEQVGITFVYVTHDQEEALTMSDRIAVMRDGLVQQLGDPITLYEKPANRFVADFIGESNLLQSRVESVSADGQVRLVLGQERMTASAGDTLPAAGGEVYVAIRPEKLLIGPPQAAFGESLSALVTQVIYIGTDTRYLVALDSGALVAVRVQNGFGRDLAEFKRGDRLKISWSPEDARTLLI